MPDLRSATQVPCLVSNTNLEPYNTRKSLSSLLMRSIGCALSAVLSLLGCWNLDSWLPRDFPQQEFRKGLRLTLPDDMAAFRLHDIVFPLAAGESLALIWRDADEQIIAAHLRPLLRINGFRIGVLARADPAAWRNSDPSLPSPPKVSHLFLRPGKTHFLTMSEPVAYFTCPVYYAGECSVAEFSQAHGGLLLEFLGRHEDGLGLRIEPVIRHQQSDATRLLLPGQSAWPLAVPLNETRFPFLAATLTLRPTETLLLGASRERVPSFGSTIFDDPQKGHTHFLLLSFLGDLERVSPARDNQALFPQPITKAKPDDPAPIP